MKTRRIAILGSRAVGKSTLAQVFIDPESYSDSYYPTIENTYSRVFSHRQIQYSLEIIDAAGHDEYSILSSNLGLGIHGYILVYSITNSASFEMLSTIRDKILNYGSVDVAFVLVGNKSDLEGQRVVSKVDVERVGAEWGCKRVECSAKLNLNIDSAFQLVLDQIDGLGGNESKCILS